MWIRRRDDDPQPTGTIPVHRNGVRQLRKIRFACKAIDRPPIGKCEVVYLLVGVRYGSILGRHSTILTSLDLRNEPLPGIRLHDAPLTCMQSGISGLCQRFEAFHFLWKVVIPIGFVPPAIHILCVNWSVSLKNQAILVSQYIEHLGRHAVQPRRVNAQPYEHFPSGNAMPLAVEVDAVDGQILRTTHGRSQWSVQVNEWDVPGRRLTTYYVGVALDVKGVRLTIRQTPANIFVSDGRYEHDVHHFTIDLQRLVVIQPCLQLLLKFIESFIAGVRLIHAKCRDEDIGSDSLHMRVHPRELVRTRLQAHFVGGPSKVSNVHIKFGVRLSQTRFKPRKVLHPFGKSAPNNRNRVAVLHVKHRRWRDQ